MKNDELPRFSEADRRAAEAPRLVVSGRAMRTRFFEPQDAFDRAADAEEAEFRALLVLVPSSVRLSCSWLTGVLNSDSRSASAQLLSSAEGVSGGFKAVEVEGGCEQLVSAATISLRSLGPRCACEPLTARMHSLVLLTRLDYLSLRRDAGRTTLDAA